MRYINSGIRVVRKDARKVLDIGFNILNGARSWLGEDFAQYTEVARQLAHIREERLDNALELLCIFLDNSDRKVFWETAKKYVPVLETITAEALGSDRTFQTVLIETVRRCQICVGSYDPTHRTLSFIVTPI